MPDAIDAAQLRRRWDAACDEADTRLRRAREVAAGDAEWLSRWLTEVDRLFVSGLDATRWDWSNGYPPGWPVTLKDRLRSFVPVHKA